MIRSMTAFASLEGGSPAQLRSWELRGVNARGLDLRLRLPDGQGGLEQTIRARLSARLSRGAISLTLRSQRFDGQSSLVIDTDQLDRVLAALDLVQERAFAKGVTLAQPTAADVLAQRGVIQNASPDPRPEVAADAALLSELDALIDAFCAMRAAEGRSIEAVLSAQIDRIEALTAEAATLAAARQDEARAAVRSALARVLEEVPDADEARLAQELALIAVRTDVTEEIDRLSAHVAAARALVAEDAPQGRRLDFLAQEFNREANTLCSKAQSGELTRVGLALKAVIDQLREQVQNIE
ncbi:MAG: YicC family protein [Rubellimicrobium sp.]|nr:YicC family protein [Rubellimicrobium sp.]